MSKLLICVICGCLLICVICGTGCETFAKSRRIAYVKKHPDLSSEQKDLLLRGKLWVGMTPEEVCASLGSPSQVQKDILGEKEVWSYIYRDQFTTHRKYIYDRIIRLEFLEGRLANWRED